MIKVVVKGECLMPGSLSLRLVLRCFNRLSYNRKGLRYVWYFWCDR
jgi:hypothetical protein